MKLYYIQAEDENGENHDRFVVAETPGEAERLWLADVPDRANLIRVREIPSNLVGSSARVISWDELPIV